MVSDLAGREALATMAPKFSRRAEPMDMVKREFHRGSLELRGGDSQVRLGPCQVLHRVMWE